MMRQGALLLAVFAATPAAGDGVPAACSTAYADDDAPTVLVVPTGDAGAVLAPQELADALDLVLGDLGIRSRTGPAITAPTFERAMASATAIGRAAHALAVVWTTPRPGGTGLFAHVLDLRAGRAIVQALSIERGAPHEDVSRVVALKVRALLRLALIERTSESSSVARLVAPVAERAAPPALVRAGLGWQAEAGASALRHGPSAAVSLALPWSLELESRLAFLDAADAEVSSGLVETTEVEATLELRRRMDAAPWLAAAAGPMARVHAVRSKGVTHDGRTGTVRAALVEVGLGASLRASAGRAIALELGLSGGLMLGRQRMLLRGHEAFDLGALGAAVRLAVVIPGR